MMNDNDLHTWNVQRYNCTRNDIGSKLDLYHFLTHRF